MSDRVETQIALKADMMRSDLVEGLVWFVNYAAIDPTAVKTSDLDLHGAAMLPQDVEKFAHRWLAYSRSIDIEHDGIGRPVHVIESFFNGTDVASPAWPINSHAVRLDVSQSKEALDGLRTGKLNSVSLDAYTFNKVVRLPAVEAKSVLGMGTNIVDGLPGDINAWAEQLMSMGYPGITSVDKVGEGLFVATRSSGLPIAVAVDFDESTIEASPAGGAWGHVAATLMTNGSLVSTQKFIGPEDLSASGSGTAGAGQPIDYAPWDEQAVIDMLESRGIIIDPSRDTHQELTDGAYAGVDFTTQKGYLPHHTLQGDQIVVSKDGVIKALSRLSEVPDELRASARAHLIAHLDDITAREAQGEAA